MHKLLLTLLLLRRPGLALRIWLARIPRALSHRWRAQITSRYKKALRPLSLERLSSSLGPLSSQDVDKLESLSSPDVAQLEDGGRAGYHNPFDPSPSPSLRDGDCSSCSSEVVLSSSSSSPTNPSQSQLHHTNPTSPLTEIITTPPPPPTQQPNLNPWERQHILKHASQSQDIEPSRAYNTVNLIHHHHNETGHRTPSPAIQHPSPLSWDVQLDKYFCADGVGMRES